MSDPVTDDVLIAQLTARRHELGLTQRAVAKRMAITHPLLCMIESGKRRPHLDTTLRYAAAVGLELRLILPGSS